MHKNHLINSEKLWKEKVTQMSDKQSGKASILPSNLVTQILDDIGSGNNEGNILDM